jgi:hypothetical protein
MAREVHSLLRNKKKLVMSTVIYTLVGLPFGIVDHISEVL